MEIILDADVVISGERGIFNLAGWLDSRPNDQFGLAAITVAELWHGVERASKAHRTHRESYLQTIVAALPIAAYTEETAYLHARIWAEIASSGKMIGAYDLIVAATTMQRGSALATFNQRHFAQVKDLQIVEPRIT